MTMNNLVLMEQVHGSSVKVVSVEDAGKTIPGCDGLITNNSALTLGVRVADCLPVTIYDKKHPVFGIIHAGWRGLYSGILINAINIFADYFKTELKNIEVDIGPHICVNHYEVKEDVSEKFKSCPSAVLNMDGKIFLDLAKVASEQLVKAGVKKVNIRISELCTFEDASLPSYRRDKTSERLIVYATNS